MKCGNGDSPLDSRGRQIAQALALNIIVVYIKERVDDTYESKGTQ